MEKTTMNGDTKSAAERLREQANTVKDDLRELGRITRDAAKDAASGYFDEAQNKYGEVEDQVVSYVRQKPLQSVLIAAGAGLILGCMLRR